MPRGRGTHTTTAHEHTAFILDLALALECATLRVNGCSVAGSRFRLQSTAANFVAVGMPVSFVHRSMLHMQLHVISPARARALCSADIARYTTDNSTVEFFIRTHQTKALVATPMFAALLVIEASDVIFAIDSIPCILGR